jgi:hypothetical protein
MPQKKKSAKKKPAPKSKALKKTSRAATKVSGRSKSAMKSVDQKKVKRTAKKPSRSSSVREIRSSEPSTLEGGIFRTIGPARTRRGTGPAAAGQAGDIQGLSRRSVVDSESVEELVEEGQAREAAFVEGVESAPDPDQGEVRTREVPEDDVPGEYDED